VALIKTILLQKMCCVSNSITEITFSILKKTVIVFILRTCIKKSQILVKNETTKQWQDATFVVSFSYCNTKTCKLNSMPLFSTIKDLRTIVVALNLITVMT